MPEQRTSPFFVVVCTDVFEKFVVNPDGLLDKSIQKCSLNPDLGIGKGACLAQPNRNTATHTLQFRSAATSFLVYVLDPFMSDRVPLQLLPLSPHQFESLPAGFEYEHSISEDSNTTAFDREVDARDLGSCVVCGKKTAGRLYPGVTRAHIIGRTEDVVWAFLKGRGLVPSSAKSVEHEPRNGINLCPNHHSDFDGYRFFVRWVPSVRVFVFVNFSQYKELEKFHGKSVVLDVNHHHSPFPALFLIQEMRTRGCHPWFTDRPIPYPRSTTYTLGNNRGGFEANLGGGSHTGVGSGGSGTMGRLGGSGGTAGSSREPPSTGDDKQYVVFGNPFQDPELLESMRREWQQLPNWKSANVEGLTWEGTAEENVKKYADLVGVTTP